MVVNIFTNQAVHYGKIKVMGGSQKRPNIHIQDMVNTYLHVLEQSDEKIQRKVWNAGDTNFPILQLAEIVKNVVGDHVEIEIIPTNDRRSYHVSGNKIREDIGFKLRYSIEDAVRDLVEALQTGKLNDPLNNPNYFNIKLMQEKRIK